MKNKELMIREIMTMFDHFGRSKEVENEIGHALENAFNQGKDSKNEYKPQK